MLDRLLLIASAALIMGLVRLAWRRKGDRRLNVDPAGATLLDGRPQLVYFWSDECHQCRWLQTPAIQRLSTELGDQVLVRPVHALAEPGIASHYGVLTLPTTVVINAHGHVEAVNHGYADEAKLRAQLGRAIAFHTRAPAETDVYPLHARSL